MESTNPDYLESRITTGDTGRLTLYATSDEPLILCQVKGAAPEAIVPPNNFDLTVHALDVCVLGPLSFPGRNVKIYCRKLTAMTLDTAEAQEAAINVSGAPPKSGMDRPKLCGSTASGSAKGKSGAELNTDGAYGKPGSPAGTITIVCDTLDVNSPLTIAANGGQGTAGADGEKGGPEGGPGGDALAGGPGGGGGAVELRFTRLIGIPSKLNVQNEGGPHGANGHPGDPGNPSAHRGAAAPPVTPALPGALTMQGDLSLDMLGDLFDEVFLVRTVQKAKRLYMMNQPTAFDGNVALPAGWTTLGQLLQWLRSVLGHYLGRSVASSQKQALAQVVDGMRLRYNGGKTYDGNDPNWVSPLKYEGMYQAFLDRMADRISMADSYVALAATLSDEKADQAALDDARRNAVATSAALSARFDKIRNELGACKPLVDDATQSLAAANTALHTALKDYQEALNNYSSCSFDQIVQAAEMMAFTVGSAGAAAAMGGVEIANLVNSGMTKIRDGAGNDIDKSLIVDEVINLGEDLDKAPQNLVGPDGKPDPRTKLLLASLDKFDDRVKDFRSKLGDNVSAEASHAIANYRNCIVEKSSLQLKYNLLATHLIECSSAMDDSQAQEDALAAKKDPVSPYSIGEVSGAAAQYQQQVDEALISLAELTRKHAFLTLNQRVRVDLREQATRLWGGGIASSIPSLAEIKTKAMSLHDDIAKTAEQRTSPSAPIVRDQYGRPLIFVSLQGALLDQFKSTGATSFTTVASDPDEAGGKLLVSGAADHYDIRVTGVQPFVLGATCANGQIYLKVRLSFQSGFVDQNRGFHVFGHMPRICDFTHPADFSYQRPYANEDQWGGKLTDSFLDSVGLFGAWQVWAPKPATASDHSNRDLCLKDVTELRVYFVGTAFTNKRLLRGL